MQKVDLVVKNGKIVSPEGIVAAGIAIDKGKIVAVAKEPNLPQAIKVIDAKGNYIIPGVVDPHAHPGGKFPLEEDIKNETPGAAAGGITTIGIINGPARIYQPYKEILDPEDAVSWKKVFNRAKEIGEGDSLVDFFFTFHINTREQANEIPDYVSEFGVTTFKFYGNLKEPAYCPVSPRWKRRMGLPAPYDDSLMYVMFENIGKVGDPAKAFVHHENTELAGIFTERLKREGRKDLAAWADHSPAFLEAEHIRRYSYYAKVTGCHLYVLHLTSKEGLEECLRAKADGVKITVETCPQYMTRTKFDDPPGLLGKVNPPLRSEEDNDALWQGLKLGWIDCLGTDHVISTRHEKLSKGDTFDHDTDPATDVWSTGSGFVGFDTLLPLMLSEGVNKGRISFERLVEVCCKNTAFAAGLYPKKGAISGGSDADLVIVDMDKRIKVSPDILHSRADFTIFEGMELRGWPVMTILRGNVIAEDGKVVAKPGLGLYLPRKPGYSVYPI